VAAAKQGRPACRLYVLPAAEAPVALVFRRGPSGWWHLLRWDLAALDITPGAWFHGNLYARRCGISPDGRLWGYFALKLSGKGAWPDTYFAVAKVPWLEALAAWRTCGTWTWGCEFSERNALSVTACTLEEPFHGHYPHGFSMLPMRLDWPLRDVWNELQRGWKPAPPADPLAAGSELVIRRGRPGGKGCLGLVRRSTDFRRGGIEGAVVEYFLQDSPDDVKPLPEAAWADWDGSGRLLVATRAGELEVRRCNGGVQERIWSADLRGLAPDPQPAPPWAGRW
jgi:hypothetical protein